MSRLAALRIYVAIFLANHPTGTSRQAREWMEQTDVGAATAADLARKGYTPDIVAAKTAQVSGEGDERDIDQIIDNMLYGPDVS